MKHLFRIILLTAAISVSACLNEIKKDPYESMDRRDRIRLKQYMQEGRRLYNVYCANCHQPDGAGLAKLYPPLRNSDFLKANKSSVICGIKHGQKGPIMVNGIEYNQLMPPVQNITDLEIAEVATYIYTEFADTVQIITLNDVRAILSQCSE